MGNDIGSSTDVEVRRSAQVTRVPYQRMRTSRPPLLEGKKSNDVVGHHANPLPNPSMSNLVTNPNLTLKKRRRRGSAYRRRLTRRRGERLLAAFRIPFSSKLNPRAKAYEPSWSRLAPKPGRLEHRRDFFGRNTGFDSGTRVQTVSQMVAADRSGNRALSEPSMRPGMPREEAPVPNFSRGGLTIQDDDPKFASRSSKKQAVDGLRVERAKVKVSFSPEDLEDPYQGSPSKSEAARAVEDEDEPVVFKKRVRKVLRPGAGSRSSRSND